MSETNLGNCPNSNGEVQIDELLKAEYRKFARHPRSKDLRREAQTEDAFFDAACTILHKRSRKELVFKPGYRPSAVFGEFVRLIRLQNYRRYKRAHPYEVEKETTTCRPSRTKSGSTHDWGIEEVHTTIEQQSGGQSPETIAYYRIESSKALSRLPPAEAAFLWNYYSDPSPERRPSRERTRASRLITKLRNILAKSNSRANP